ncbi:hypothetical protein ACVMB3_000571 [Sinorhizobium meliloti]|jgi:hypothetical protein|nr:hypothetical protein T190_19790 [Sinorhizobium meliloti CCBAU 01290]
MNSRRRECRLIEHTGGDMPVEYSFAGKRI